MTARPGQESADLGRLLYAFRCTGGASLALLTLTRGEASPLNSTCERLEIIRPWELQVAAGLLGISSLMLADYADGKLNRYPVGELTERVRRAIHTHAADLLLVIEPAGPDDAAVAQAAASAAEQTGVPVLARMPHAARSGWHVDLGADAAAARAVAAIRPGRARQPGRSPAPDAAPDRPAGRPRAAPLAGPAAPHVRPRPRPRVTEIPRLDMPRIRRIIVGVSGSSRGLPALRWAADLARTYQAELFPVHAWVPPCAALAGHQFPSEQLYREWEEAASRRLARALELAFGGHPPGLRTRPVIAEGTPGQILVRAACRPDDLLVIGTAAGPRSADCGTAGSAATAWPTPAVR